eukprot:9170836-Alexandrium_andersonii.AAC.1
MWGLRPPPPPDLPPDDDGPCLAHGGPRATPRHSGAARPSEQPPAVELPPNVDDEDDGFGWNPFPKPSHPQAVLPPPDECPVDLAGPPERFEIAVEAATPQTKI